MSSDKVTIFYTGATGYVGASALQRILAHPKANTFEITALVRSKDKAKALEDKFGLKTVKGSLQDLDILTEQAEKAHVVIHTADCDDVPAIKAILAGMKSRHEKLGDRPVLIHTSGTGVLRDNARGQFLSSQITSDVDLAALEAIPADAPHHPVDLLVTAADTDGYARTYLIFPSMIWGVATGPLFDAGLANPLTIVVPWLVRVFQQRGIPGIVGTGAAAWAVVNVNDNADVYYRIFDAVVIGEDGKLGHGPEGYYFVENGEQTMYNIIKVIGEALVALGKISESEPTQYTEEELTQYFMTPAIVDIIFGNTRCRADRARQSLGWVPKYDHKDLLKDLQAQVEASLKVAAAKSA